VANKESYLGEFEHVVLLSILNLKENAYGNTIRQYLHDAIDRDVSVGALYSTAERLENKGLLSSTKSGATAERGGKAKRYFKVTALGMSALSDTKAYLEQLWKNAPENYTACIGGSL
jgi:DNA-binding PadR family transcriptional regulator